MKALIVVDVQRDFCEDGSLEVAGGKDLAERIKTDLLKSYSRTVATKDYHNPFTADSDNNGHFSNKPNYITTWPPHCVGGTSGANLMFPLYNYMFMEIFRKGRGIAAYSGFQGVGQTSGLTLDEYLRGSKVDKVDVCGIALDHCVKATVDDALTLGYEVNVLSDYTVAVDEGLRNLVLHNLRGRGANII